MFRDIIRKVERSENLKNKAILVSGLVEWKYQLQDGSMVPFDIHVNLQLEEALEKKQSVQIKIKNNTYVAHPELKTAVPKSGRSGQGRVELLRKDLKGERTRTKPVLISSTSSCEDKSEASGKARFLT